MIIFNFLKPNYFIKFLNFSNFFLIPFIIFFFCLGINLGLYNSPIDFQQGETYKIIYLHVPTAWMSLLLYLFLSFSSFIYLLESQPFSFAFSKTFCILGFFFTLITLFSGSFWGKVMWGTFWVWDARLTSVFILFILYLSIYLLFTLISPSSKAMKLSSIFAIFGLFIIPVIKFSVDWWNTLHQSSSTSSLSTSVHFSFFYPLIFIFISFILLTFFFLFISIKLLYINRFTSSLSFYSFHSFF